MANGDHRDTFKEAAPDTKMLMLFDGISDLQDALLDHTKQQVEACSGQARACNDRIRKLEDRKKLDTGIAAGSGIVGGALAFMGKWFFFKG